MRGAPGARRGARGATPRSANDAGAARDCQPKCMEEVEADITVDKQVDSRRAVMAVCARHSSSGLPGYCAQPPS